MALPILNHKENKRWLRRHKKLNMEECPTCKKDKPLMANINGDKICSNCYWKTL